MEDVFLFRLRLACARELRTLSGDGKTIAGCAGSEDGVLLDPCPPHAHPRPLRPVQGRRSLSSGLDRAQTRERMPNPCGRNDRALGRRKDPALRRHIRARGLERYRWPAGRFVHGYLAAASTFCRAAQSDDHHSHRGFALPSRRQKKPPTLGTAHVSIVELIRAALKNYRGCSRRRWFVSASNFVT